jgi:hypothetical protein
MVQKRWGYEKFAFFYGKFFRIFFFKVNKISNEYDMKWNMGKDKMRNKEADRLISWGNEYKRMYIEWKRKYKKFVYIVIKSW